MTQTDPIVDLRQHESPPAAVDVGDRHGNPEILIVGFITCDIKPKTSGKNSAEKETSQSQI